jgi:hypothetical protein
MTNYFVRYERTLLKLTHQRLETSIQGGSSLYPVTYSQFLLIFSGEKLLN